MDYKYKYMDMNDLELVVSSEIENRILEPDVFPKFNQEKFRENFINNDIKDFKMNEVILCIDNGKIIGRIDLMVEKSFMDFKSIGYIDWVYVSKPYRNKGLAKKLFIEAKIYFDKLECDLYYLFVASNEQAKGFYKSIDIEIENIERASKKLK